MTGREDQNWGDRIQDIVDDAINSRDFERLSRGIRSTIDDVFDEWKIGPGTRTASEFDKYRIPYEGRRHYYKSFEPGPRQWQSTERKPVGTQLYARNVPGTLLGPVAMAAGGVLTGIMALSSLMVLAGGILAGEPGFAFGVTGMIMVPLTAASAVLCGWGVKLRNRARRFKNYVSVLGDRTFCPVDELAAAVDKDHNYVVKDLKKMIGGHFFLHGHLDRLNTTLMVDDATYRQYLETDQSFRERQEEQKQKRQEEQKIFASAGTEDPEFVRAIAEGADYIKEIRAANEQIPGEEISRKLYRLEDVLKRIFAVLQQKPDQLSRLRKFMNYYMPTTRKLVQTYKELDSQTVSGENINRAKAEIEQTLDTINDAYEKLLDSFYEDAVMDIHTDRAVLENMLTEDGLKGSPFEQAMVQQGH